jgi:hypothetical protein
MGIVLGSRQAAVASCRQGMAAKVVRLLDPYLYGHGILE